MFVINVAVPIPLRQLFSYSHPHQLNVGVRVSVPFGSRMLVGVVLSCEKDKSQNDDSNIDLAEQKIKEKLKAIDVVLDDKSFLSEEFIALGQWVADYYHYPIGEAFISLLPSWLRKCKTQTEILRLISQAIIKITPDGVNALSSTETYADKQRNLLASLKNQPLSKQDILANISRSTLITLKKKGWVEQIESVPDAEISWRNTLTFAERPTATLEQGVAIGSVNTRLDKFSISLLEGITGSGKTEVYLQVIEAVLRSGKQALVLVPEIGLTPQTVNRFKTRFGVNIGVLNSSVSDRQRLQIWLQAKLGLLAVVIGTRSAVFTPFLDLGVIVIDEEHDDALKQQDGLRYHARDVAAIRAKKHNIPLLLGSATPSLESLNNALSGKYHHFLLRQRAANAQTVTQHLLDIKHQVIHGGLSEIAIAQMRRHLSEGNQVLLFLNRRGYSPVLMCHDCGHIEVCSRCERPMTWHKHARRMQCHQCETQRAVPLACKQCHSQSIVPDGLGTEQLESVVTQIFPQYNVVRIDRDSTRKKGSFEQLNDDIHSGKTNILIGTQMLAKGHHFPNVTLVVLIDVDGGLFSLDTRSQEKLSQLVTQISGRAGRASKKGEMILQTHHPEHPILQELINNGYGHVARLLLAERKALHSPPYCAQAVLRAEDVDKNICVRVLTLAKQVFQSHPDIIIIGPMPALIDKRMNRYRFILVLRASSRKVLHQQIHRAVYVLDGDKEAKRCRWSVDVDAIDFT